MSVQCFCQQSSTTSTIIMETLQTVLCYKVLPTIQCMTESMVLLYKWEPLQGKVLHFCNNVRNYEVKWALTR